jgi:hypothetical protein
MRLRIESPSKPPFWFVGHPNVNVRQFSEAMDLAVNIQRQQQQIPGAGQELADFEDRGNQRVTLQATTTREFASAIERMDFMSRLAPVDPAAGIHEWQGDVIVREEVGSSFAEWRLPNAVLSLAAVDPVGAVTLRLRYVVQAGGFGEAIQGLFGVAITAVTAVPAEVRLSDVPIGSGWPALWISDNADGDLIQVSWVDYEPTLENETYIFEVDTGGGVDPGRIAVSAGDNLAEIAAWLNANTILTAEATGGDLIIRTPSREGMFVDLMVEMISLGFGNSTTAGPVEVATVMVADADDRIVTADILL